MAKEKKHKAKQGALATNRKAQRDYEILETYEVGIELKGTEIKSIRQRLVSLDDSFARIEEGQLVLYNMHINPYAQGGRYNVEPARRRRLLMHRREINRLAGQMSLERVNLIPLRLYLKNGFAKIALAVGKGRRSFEKRDVIRKRETDREIQSRLRRSAKGHKYDKYD